MVERAGHATVQDLGRPGRAHLGISANGAADAHAARVDFQDLGARVLRAKNLVVVSYRVGSGAIAAVGGRDLREAVIKAATRLEFTAKRLTWF